MDTYVVRGETLSLWMCPKIEKEKEDMSRVPYSSATPILKEFIGKQQKEYI